MVNGLFELWFLATASDSIGAALGALLLFRLGTRFGRYLCLVFVALSVEAALAAASLILFLPEEATLIPYFAIARSAGRGLKAVAVWCLVFYLFNLCGRKPRGSAK